MKLPGADRAFIKATKVHGYLLSDAHPVVRFKASFFASLGYSAAQWEVLEVDLRLHALENDATATESNVHGQKYETRGRMSGPAGKAAWVVAVWIVLHGEDFPRFVTAFPGAKS